MESEQVLKQLDWLDDQRRKDKTAIELLEKRLSALEGDSRPLGQQMKDLGGEITRLGALLARMDHFDEALLQTRVEARQSLEALEKEIRKRDEETEKIRRVELRAVDESIAEVRKEVAPLAELRRGLQARVEEDTRLARAIDEVRLRMDTLRRSDEEYTRAYHLLEDGRRQDAKRITDLQGEAAALRKHMDDQRGKMELTSNTLRRIESRLNELSQLEAERREAQNKFLEAQALIQVERERAWKEWQARFDVIERQTSEVEANLQALDATHRAVKRSQQALEELSQLVERRINETAEIQRLTEERFRQEWVTFKSDDQKRWTNYTLTQEEQRGETTRQYDRLAERVTQVEDSLQEADDLIAQMNEQTEKRLQSLLAAVHDWVTAFERSVGRAR
jgi:chromosome segregation ATPase